MDNGQALELIELAQRNEAFCHCGRSTLPVGRGDDVWLECASLQERHGGAIRRLFSADAFNVHTRRLIVEGPALRCA